MLNNQHIKTLVCDSSCLDCDNTAATCISCTVDKYFKPSTNTCEETCSSLGFYISGDECLACDSSCYTCSGDTN